MDTIDRHAELRTTLARTLPSEEFTQPSSPPASPPADAAVEADRFTLTGASLTHRLREHGCITRHPTGGRFESALVIGDGANGRVYAVRDRDLDREVAVKFLKSSLPPASDEAEAFIAEARTTAALEHPNVLPVHEIDVNDHGQIFFSMKRITGSSLGEAIQLSTPQSRRSAIATPLRIAAIIRGVAQALAYAHQRGIVHQDVKPDNIMLGEYGEVLLVDWGSAARLEDDHPRMYGTPLYMSPEQARLERSDQRSDIYCLGATLFHALILRVPTWSDDVDTFWQKKRSGTIDAGDADELGAMPRALAEIARKAMAPLADDRYPRIDDLLADLDAFQAGLAISAHRDSPLEILARWHRRHARAIWSTAAAVVIITVLGGLLYGERLKERASWGSPVLIESFVDDSWKQRWEVTEGGFTPVAGGLVSGTSIGCCLTNTTKLVGDVAIEFTGEIEPKAFLCDLSFFWDRDLDLEKHRGHIEETRPGLCYLQVGSQGNSYTSIRGEDGHHIAYSPFRLEAVRRYRVRMEAVGNRLSLLVDGKELCHYVDPFPMTGGHVSIYTFGVGKRISDVRIFERSLPQRVPPTAIADTFFGKRQFADARDLYDKIARDQAASALGDEAIYKSGLCSLRLGHEADALSRWAPLRTTTWSERLRLHDIDRALAEGRQDDAVAEMAALAKSSSEEIRGGVATAWSQAVLHAGDRARAGEIPISALTPFFALLDGPLAGTSTTDESAARAMVVCGWNEQVIARYPQQLTWVVEARSNLGRDDEAIRLLGHEIHTELAYQRSGRTDELFAADPDYRPYDHILYEMGRWDLLEKSGGPLGYYAMGRFDPLINEPIVDHGIATRVHLVQDHPEVVTDPRQRQSLTFLMATGDTAEALARYGDQFTQGMWPRHLAGLEAYIAGDHRRAYELFAVPERWRFNQAVFHLMHYVVIPFLRELDGDAGALDRACAEVLGNGRWIYRQWPWYNASWLTHRIDDQAFLAQPCRGFAPADLELLRAITSERAKDRDAALAAYRRYLAIPRIRRWTSVDPVRERFVAWRVGELESAR